MARLWRTKLFYIFLLVIVIILSAEFWARSYDPMYYLSSRNFWKLDRYTNLGGQFDGKEKLALWHTGVNFNETVVVKKPVGITRIIILGTSSTEGYRLPRQDNFPSQLQRLLDGSYGTGKFEVINASVGGYVSYQLLVYFQEVLLKLSPDVTILYLGHNDCLAGPFTVRSYYEKVKKAFMDLGDDRERKKRLLKHGLNSLNPVYALVAESRLWGYVLIKMTERFFLKTFLMPPADKEYVLQEFAALSRQHGFTLIFAPEVVRKRLEFQLQPYHVLMRRIAEKERVPFINTVAALKKYPDDVIFNPQDDVVHLNKFGCGLMAQALCEAMKDRL